MEIAIEVVVGPTHACPSCGRETLALHGIGLRIATRCSECVADDTTLHRLVMPVNVLTAEAVAGLARFRAGCKHFASIATEHLAKRKQS